MRTLLFALVALLLAPSASAQLVITGVFDGPLSGGTPKAVELYATEAIADLSTYTVANYNNGGATISNSVVLSGSATAGQHIYVTRSGDEANFQTYFGFAPTLFPGNAPSVNGDDAVAVLRGETIVDVFGEIGVRPAEGELWNYLDGWAYRSDGTSASATFTAADWTFSGSNATDGCTTNASCASVFPAGTFAGGTGGGDNTSVQFSLETASIAEDSGEYDLNLQITGASATTATTVVIALGGSARSLDDFEITPPGETDPIDSIERITLVFAAGSVEPKIIRIVPNDDRIDELDETLVLTIESVSGGSSAAAGSPSTFTLTLIDPNTTENPSPITIATARALPDGDRVLVRGVISRVKGDFGYIQDGTGGIALRQPLGSFKDQITSGAVVAGDSVEVTGKLASFRGLKQFNADSLESVTVIQKGAGVRAPLVRTLAQLAADSESFESQLVRVEGVTFSQTGPFAERTTYQITQGGATFDVRIGNANDTDIDGTTIPSGATSVTAILSQFESPAGSGGGYQLLPIRAGDVGDAAPLAPTVRFAMESATVSEDAGAYTFRVTLDNPSATAATTVDVSLAGGTATNGTDIATFSTQTLTFAANTTTAQEVTVTPVDDGVEEAPETLIFTLSNASATLGTPSTFTLTISDPGANGDQTIFVGQTGETLQASIRATYTPSTLGYDRARDQMYGFVWNQNGSLSGIYTGRTISVRANPSTARSDASAGNFNAEHLWPQSQGAGDEPARSNLFNLAPTDNPTNSDRGNLPFGLVTSSTATNWYRGTTKQSQTPSGDLGLWSRRSSSRFEPRDEFKGDIARSQFYFYTIYQDRSNTTYWNAVKDVLFQWHQSDPVSSDELTRHDRIVQVQGKDNPYVLDPTLVGRAFFGQSGGGGGAMLALSTIADARALDDGSRVRFRGVVTRARGTALYLEDGTAGLNVRQFTGTIPGRIEDGSVAVGDSVEVIGSVSSFRGLKQIFGNGFESLEVVVADAGVRSPLVVTAAELTGARAESLESRLIQVSDVTFTQTGTFAANMTYAATSSGAAIDIRFGSNAIDSDLIGTAIPTGPVRVTGVLGQFDPNEAGVGYQLLPIEAGDIATLTNTLDDLASGVLDVRLFPVPARDALTIALSQPTAAGTSVEIVDLMGRIVQRTSVERQTTSVSVSSLSSGVYLMRLTLADGSVAMRRSFTIAR